MKKKSSRSKPRQFPISYEGWERAAKRVLKAPYFDYVYAGAGEDRTSRANRDAFYKWRFVPRVLRDVSSRDLTVNLYGTKMAAPILVAPMGGNKNLHPDAEIGLGRAASITGIPLILSNVASTSIEDLASVMEEGARWFQIYPCKDLEVMASFVRRARAAKYGALVVTVDRAAEYPRYGSAKDQDRRGRNMQIFLTDPVFRAKAKGLGGRDAAVKLYDQIRMNSSFTWEDLEFLRKEAQGLPFLLKGILHPKDAELALEHGFDGIIISNHGGRRMDGEVASLDVLPEIRNTVGEKMTILLDSGIRNGADIVKAIALGAKSVLVGHLCAYALAVGGQAGVAGVIKNLMREMDSALAICGCRSIDELDESILFHY